MENNKENMNEENILYLTGNKILWSMSDYILYFYLKNRIYI